MGDFNYCGVAGDSGGSGILVRTTRRNKRKRPAGFKAMEQ